jgi:hypothetical protein
VDSNIEKEIEAKEGGTVWSDRHVRLVDYIVSKNASKKNPYVVVVWQTEQCTSMTFNRISF